MDGVTLVLDSGGVSALAGNRSIVEVIIKRGQWPPLVPAVVLAESLTGDHRRDFHVNRLLRLCTINPVTEPIARRAAALRYRTAQSSISAVDAVVVATADHAGGAVVCTTDPKDLHALAQHTLSTVEIEPV